MDAYERLREATIERTPGCVGIESFTADYITPSDREFLRQICTNCDLQLVCREYVAAERPRVGFWAGDYYGPCNRPVEAA